MQDVRRQLNVVLRWLPLIVVVVLAFGGLAYLLTSMQSPVYEARGELIVSPGPNPDVGDLVVTEQVAAQVADVGRTRRVADTIMAELGLDESFEDFSRRVSVSSAAGSAIVEVTARSGDPDEARTIVESISAELVRQSAQQVDATPSEAVDEYLTSIQLDIARTQGRLDALVGLQEPTIEESAELVALEDRLTALQRNYADLLPFSTAFASNLLSVYEAPVTPRSSVEPRPLFWTMLALAVGLLLATAIAFVLEYLRGGLRDEHDLQRATNLPVLGVVEELRRDVRGGPADRLVTSRFPRSQGAESFRSVRSALQSTDADLKSLLVTSALPSEGKTAIAANLAIAYAEAGSEVVLVDADLREPSVHAYFGLSNDQGLMSLVADEMRPTASALATIRPGLRVLTSGRLPLNPAEVIGSRAFRNLLAGLGNESDLVIVNAPPLPKFADAVALAGMTQAMLLVVSKGSQVSDVVDAVRPLVGVRGVRIAGTVLRRQVRGSHAGDASGSREPGQTKGPPSPSKAANSPVDRVFAEPPATGKSGPYALSDTSDSS